MKKHRTYKLEEYNSNWPKDYQKRANILKSILGDEVVNIEHIGSTSIPGMLAKPQIDIQIEVKELKKIKNFYKKMEERGFTPRGDYSGINEEYFTEDDNEGKRLASIHILQTGNPELFNDVICRDYLISNEEDRKLYISVKKDLYSKYSNDYALYDSGKKEIIDYILKKAKQWRQNNIKI